MDGFKTFECQCCGGTIYILDDDYDEIWYCDECEERMMGNELDNLELFRYYEEDIFRND